MIDILPNFGVFNIILTTPDLTSAPYVRSGPSRHTQLQFANMKDTLDGVCECVACVRQQS